MLTASPRFTVFGSDPVTLAQRLLGQRLVRMVDGVRLSGIIVETEAYLGAVDRAAHTFNGRRTARNASMFLGGGFAYVYFTYGMHYCFNVVCGSPGDGVAVLIRAVQPLEGIEIMQQSRTAARKPRDLCSGPARLTQAFQIDRRLDGVNLLSDDRLSIEQERSRRLPARNIASGPRIGVEYAGEWAAAPLRFWILGNPHVSR